MLPPLKWMMKYSVRVSVGVDEDIAEKGGGYYNVNMNGSVNG